MSARNTSDATSSSKSVIPKPQVHLLKRNRRGGALNPSAPPLFIFPVPPHHQFLRHRDGQGEGAGRNGTDAGSLSPAYQQPTISYHRRRWHGGGREMVRSWERVDTNRVLIIRLLQRWRKQCFFCSFAKKRSGVPVTGNPASLSLLLLVEKESHLYSSHINILAASGKTHDVLEYLLRGLNKCTCFFLHKRLYMLNNQFFTYNNSPVEKKLCAGAFLTFFPILPPGCGRWLKLFFAMSNGFCTFAFLLMETKL